MIWSDMIIDLNQEFGIVVTEKKSYMNQTSWIIEKSSENLEYVITLELNEEVSKELIVVICDEMRIPRIFFNYKN
jgi:hypothetical protein